MVAEKALGGAAGGAAGLCRGAPFGDIQLLQDLLDVVGVGSGEAGRQVGQAGQVVEVSAKLHTVCRKGCVNWVRGGVSGVMKGTLRCFFLRVLHLPATPHVKSKL